MALDPAAIHYGIRGQRFGPVDLHTLVEKLRAGQISADDYLWDEDLGDWVVVRRYAVLLASLEQALPDEIHEDDPRLSALADNHPSVAPPSGDARPAGFGLRLIAYLIDGLTLLIPISLWIMYAEHSTGFDFTVWSNLETPTPEQFRVFWNYMLLSQSGVFFIHGVYHALLESSSWQATIGKRVMGIRVTDEEGRRIGIGRAVARHFGRILCELTLFVGYLMVAYTRRGQGLHDRIAGTLVVRNDGS